MSDDKRLLVVAPEAPWPATHGGRVDIWKRYEGLAAEGWSLALLFWSKSEARSIALNCSGFLAVSRTGFSGCGELGSRFGTRTSVSMRPRILKFPYLLTECSIPLATMWTSPTWPLVRLRWLPIVPRASRQS